MMKQITALGEADLYNQKGNQIFPRVLHKQQVCVATGVSILIFVLGTTTLHIVIRVIRNPMMALQ